MPRALVPESNRAAGHRAAAAPLSGPAADVASAAAPLSGRAADAATRRIVTGPLAREIARFGTPLALGMALQTTFNLVDAYLVAQLPHDEVGPALGALGICDQIAAIGTIVSYGISTATSALLALDQGAGDTRAVQRTAWQSLMLVAGLGAVFGVLGVGFAGPIVRDVVGAKGEVAALATQYLRVIVGGSFTIFFLLQLTSMQRALGSAKTPAALLVGGNVLNLLLAVLLIFGPGPAPALLSWSAAAARVLHVPRLGMLGVAWATVAARAVVLVPVAWILVRRFRVLRPPPGEVAPRADVLRRIAHLAWPSSAQFVLRIAAMLLVNSLVARFFTTASDQTASTAIGLVFRLDTMALFVAMGWGSAAQTFVGQNLGAGLQPRARRAGWVTALYDALTNVALLGLVLWAGAAILRLFDPDDAPVSIALEYLHAVAPSWIALGVGVVLGNAMAGAGATRHTFWIDLAVILGFQFPACIAAVAAFGASRLTLFQLVAATNVVSAIAYSAVFARGAWTSATTRSAGRSPS
jgi:putative MATE family efflux protein